MGTGFLAVYWAIFTAAVFLSRHEKFAGPPRAIFLTFNNVAFFALFLLTMFQMHTNGFWKFSISYGIVLLALAAVARKVLAGESSAKNSYLSQGLLLVTVGLISRYTGTQLALVLAAESVVLFLLGRAVGNRIMEIGSCFSAVMAAGWGIGALERFDARSMWSAVAVGALVMVNAIRAHVRAAPTNSRPIRPYPAYFAFLAFVIWGAAAWFNTSTENFPVVLSVMALMLTMSVYLLPMWENPLLAQGYLVLAQFVWLSRFADPAPPPVPWWNPAVLIAVTLVMGHWWPRQSIVNFGGRAFRSGWEILYAILLMGVLYFWLRPLVSRPEWLVCSNLLAVVLTVYGLLTRAWPVAAFGQVFAFIGVGEFAFQLWDGQPEWYLALTPILVLAALPFVAIQLFERTFTTAETARQPLSVAALVYRWTALAMSLWWVRVYTAESNQAWVLVLAGLAAFLWAGWRKNAGALQAGAALLRSPVWLRSGLRRIMRPP